MTKQIRAVICIATVFAVLLLSGCKGNANGNNSSDSNGSAAQSSQSSETYCGHTSSATDSTESNTSSSVTNSGSSVNSATSSGSQSSSISSSTESQIHTHSYTAKKIAATCLAGGYTLKTCACGYSEQTDKVSAKGHSFGEWKTVTAPTSTSAGSEKRVCSRCSTTETRAVAKLPQSVSEKQAEILRLVNVERQKAGLDPLQYYAKAQAAADVRAVETAELFSHTRPNGTSCFTALHEADVYYYAAGENIAYGYPTCESVMEGWMNSDGHRANILSSDFTHLVVGVYETQVDGYTRIYWVQLFVTPA